MGSLSNENMTSHKNGRKLASTVTQSRCGDLPTAISIPLLRTPAFHKFAQVVVDRLPPFMCVPHTMPQLQQSNLSFALAAPLPLFSTRWRPSRQSRYYRYRLMSRSVAVATTDAPRADDPPGPTFAPPPPQTSSNEKDSLLIDPDDREFVEWASTAERDVSTEPPDEADDDIIDLLTIDDGPAPPSLDDEQDDEEVELEIVGKNVDEEDDDDDTDEDDDNEDEDEDEELAAQADAEDYEDDIPISTLSKRGGRISTVSRMSGPLAAVDVDDNDDIDDADEILETIDDDIPPIFDGPAALEEVHPSIDGADKELFEEVDEESEEDIRSAADILSNSGLLGLGVEGGKRADISEVTSFAMGDVEGPARPPAPVPSEQYDDEVALLDVDDEDLDEEEEQQEDLQEGKRSLESYMDADSEEDDDDYIPLTSKSSSGRIWELNDDNYVTITEPGQAYAYELDEEDQEDQEMSTMRRGKQGGWSGGLASYSARDMPKGSPEWVARRAYELVAKSNQVEMFKWTRRHRGPPPIIDKLYPADPPPPPRIPRTRLQFSTPDTGAGIVGTDSSSVEDEQGRRQTPVPEKAEGSHALDRAVNFPCQYKFKVEGSGDDLIDSLIADTEKILGKPVPDSAVHVQPAGRYKRVEIMVEVTSARQVTDLYDTLRNNSGVKYSFG